MNKNFKPPQNQKDHMSTEVDKNTFRSANGHQFRAFYISSDGSWQIKESVQNGYLRDITGISGIVNCNRGNTLCDNLFVSKNIMNETKNNHKTGTSRVDLVVNKLNQNDQSLTILSIPGSHVNFSPREKKGFSRSFKRKKHPERNLSKTLPNKSVTKFMFKDLTPEFDPGQDIFESSTKNENDYDSEFSSASKEEKSQKTNNDLKNTFRTEEIKNEGKNTHNETRKLNNTKLSCVENLSRDKLYPSPQKRQKEDIVAENLTMLEELISSGTIDETSVDIVEHKKEKRKINTCSQEKNPLSKKSEHTANSNCNLINPINLNAFNQDSLVTVSKEIQRKTDGKDSNVGDLNPKMRIDQVAQISTIKRKKTISTNVITKLETYKIMSIGNSNKHKMNLKINSSQKMKGNLWIESPKKQTDIITTNSPSEIDESQKQIDGKNSCNTNTNKASEKDDISSKVTKSQMKEKFKNNMNNINADSSTEKFPNDTDLNAEENKSPRKKKKHNRGTLKNSNSGEEHLSVEVQDKNEILIENILTDLKARENITPRKRKRHSQDKVKSSTGIDVDKQLLCKESQDMFRGDTPNYNDREKTMSPNVNTDRMTSIENSNKHKIKLKTKSTQEMKRNSQIEMSEKQKDVIATNTPEKQTDVITTDTPEKQTIVVATNISKKQTYLITTNTPEKQTVVIATNIPKKQKDVIATNTPEKQTYVITTNIPMENDETQKQTDEKNTCSTNLNIAIEKDGISSKVTKSHMKEKFKNNMNHINTDSSAEKFPNETDLKAEENKSPRKKKKHNRDKLKNSNSGGEHLSVEVQDRNEILIENILTDLKARENITPRKRKRHSQDKVKSSTGIDVDKQLLCKESQYMFRDDTPNYNDREKTMSPNVNTDRMTSIESSNKHKIKLKTKSSREMKGNSQIKMSEKQKDVIATNTPEKQIGVISTDTPKKQTDVITTITPEKQTDVITTITPEKQTDVITTNTPMENDESQEQRNEKKTCNTNLNMQLGKDYISCEVSKSLRKETGEQENSDANDPGWNWDDESCTSTSSFENEADRKMCKKHIAKSRTHSKEQPEISRKNKPLLVSSTPFPKNKNKKEDFSELGENSSYRFNNTSENKSNDNSIPSNQTIMEEIQCKMIASEADMKALKKLKIEVDWELSPLHKIDTGSGKVNASQLRGKLGSKHSKLLDDSKFTEEDENKIRKSWEEFAQTYGFSNPELFFPSEQNFGCFSYTERHHFKLFLSKYLPNRRLLSVYLKFVNMYGVKKKGRWSNKEDRLLLDLYFACTRDNSSDGDSEESQRQPKLGLPMKKIMAKALDRTIMSVDSRLKILLENENAKSLSQKDISWTLELEGTLIHRLLKKSKVDSLEDLRHATISYKVWRKVVTKLELPLDKVVNHWKYILYPQLFARQPVLRHLLQMELINWFYNSDIRDVKSVDWSDLSRRAGDLGSCYLYRVFSTLMCNCVPKEFSKNFRESVTFLHEQYLPKLKKKTTSHMLIRKFYDPDTRKLNVRTEDEADCVPFRIE